MKKIVYLIIVLLTVFSFNMEVEAAKELTCIATSQNDDNCLMLKQLSNGDFEMFAGTKSNGSCQSIEWNKKNISSNDLRKMIEKNKKQKNYFDSSYNLYTCPTKINSIMDNGETIYYFKDSDDTNTGEEIEANKERLLESFTVEQYTSNDGGSSSVENDNVINGNTSEMMPQNNNLYGKACKDIKDSDKWLADLGNYSGACLYQKSTSAGCMVVQLNYSSTGVKAFVYAPKYFAVESLNGVPNFEQIKSYSPIISEEIQASFLKNVTKGECFGTIYMSGGLTHEENSYEFKPYNINQSFGDDLWLTDSKGDNFVSGEELEYKDFDDLTFEENNLLNCDYLFGEESEELKDLIKIIYNLVKILIPFIIIGFSVLDFAKVVFSGSEDDMKKTKQRLVKRLLVAVAIFLVPALLKLILTISYDIWGILSPTFCGIL